MGRSKTVKSDTPRTIKSIYVNDVIWQRFKAICAIKGIKIEKALDDMLTEYNEKNIKSLK